MCFAPLTCLGRPSGAKPVSGGEAHVGVTVRRTSGSKNKADNRVGEDHGGGRGVVIGLYEASDLMIRRCLDTFHCRGFSKPSITLLTAAPQCNAILQPHLPVLPLPCLWNTWGENPYNQVTIPQLSRWKLSIQATNSKLRFPSSETRTKTLQYKKTKQSSQSSPSFDQPHAPSKKKHGKIRRRIKLALRARPRGLGPTRHRLQNRQRIAGHVAGDQGQHQQQPVLPQREQERWKGVTHAPREPGPVGEYQVWTWSAPELRWLSLSISHTHIHTLSCQWQCKSLLTCQNFSPPFFSFFIIFASIWF